MQYYYWTNAGFKAAGNLEAIFQGTNYIGHVDESDTQLVNSTGRNIAWYAHNNLGTYKFSMSWANLLTSTEATGIRMVWVLGTSRPTIC